MSEVFNNNGHSFGSNGHHKPDDDPEEPEEEQNSESNEEEVQMSQNWRFDDSSFWDIDLNFVPTGDELADAAMKALHNEVAFLILHRDNPQTILDRMERIIEVARAASQVKGPHQTKAIKLGLAIKSEYWMHYHNIRKWQALLLDLLSTARDLEDYELQYEIYRVWGFYLYATHQQPGAAKALETALEYAADLKREDLQLLARVERFNLQIPDMKLEDAQIEASAILHEAHRLNAIYVQGRVYFSLARAFQYASQFDYVFMYAQQALAIFLSAEIIGLAGEAVSKMLASGQVQNDHAMVYQLRLLALLEALAKRTPHPWFQVSAYHHWAAMLYHRQQYDAAREYILKAWAKMREIKYMDSQVRAKHLLAMIQAKRQRWGLARRYLQTCIEKYREANDHVQSIHAKHAIAFVFDEQGNYQKSLDVLKEALGESQALPEGHARRRLIMLLQADIEDVERRIADNNAATSGVH